MEDEKFQTLRKKIQEIQKDQSLSNAEKARKIQLLMSGKQDVVQKPQKSTDGKEEEIKTNDAPLNIEKTFKDKEKKILGCKHYKVNCKIRAACCGQLFTCRLCHDEIISEHKIDRYATKEMFCMLCDTLQLISQTCSNCKQQVSRYYCDICKFHDDTPDKDIYHCPDCGICRLGKGLDIDFYHCSKCNACLAIKMKNNHICIENNMKSNCSICHNDLFTSRTDVTILKCGHPMHQKCFTEYLSANEFTCPLCSKSIIDMKAQWVLFDRLIQMQPMPSEFSESKANILCSDCSKKNTVSYHFVGLKCNDCGSYNTKILSTTGFPTVTTEIPQVSSEQLNALAAEVQQEFNQSGEEEEDEEEDEGEDEEDDEEENVNESSK